MAKPLETYLSLEHLMLELDDEGDEELADKLRDVMDVVWYSRLSQEHRDLLNRRTSPHEPCEGSSAEQHLFIKPPVLVTVRRPMAPLVYPELPLTA